MLKGYYKLGRPTNAVAGFLAVVLGGYVAGVAAWTPVLLAGLATLLITISSNAWNDYLDIDIDRVNQPQRPLPSGQISPRGALIFSLVGTSLSLVAAAFINPPAFFIALGSNIILYLYSWKLKSTVLLGNAAVASIIALCFIFGGVAAGAIGPTIWLAITAFFAMMGREILKTMADYAGDLRQNCHTIATVWGKKMARIFFLTFLGIAAVVMLAPYFLQHYSAVYLYILLFGVYPLLVYIGINATSNAPAQTLERMSQMMKYDFFVWFLAVALGTTLAAG